MNKSFSERQGFRPEEVPITIREDAPEYVRNAVIQIAVELEIQPSEIRDIICSTTFTTPDSNNWSEYPNIWNEVNGLIYQCEWYYVYDVAEKIHSLLKNKFQDARPSDYENRINEIFRVKGIGWKMFEGLIEIRGTETFEEAVRQAEATTLEAGRTTVSSEIKESLRDLSKRPHPDLTGAIQHSMAALECLARDITGESSSTLGRIISDGNINIPPPLDTAVEKLWGFASQMGRHLLEGNNPNYKEAELVVFICASLISYLNQQDS